MKKILFLDFDGVLVTDRGQQRQLATGGTLRDEHGALFDPESVEFLKQIIDSTDAEIVVTSTWKMEMGFDGIRQMWSDRDLPGEVIGVTPDIDPIHRGEEIAAWLTSYGEDCRYAIIDDTPFTDFFLEEQLPHLFKVDERTGIDEETAKRVIAHFQSASKLCTQINISVADDDDNLSKAELLSIQKGMEDIKNGRTYKMQEGESLTDFLNRTEA